MPSAPAQRATPPSHTRRTRPNKIDKPEPGLDIVPPRERYLRLTNQAMEVAIDIAKGTLIILLYQMLVLGGWNPLGCKADFALRHSPLFAQLATFLVIYMVFVITGVEGGGKGPGPTPVETFLGAVAAFLIFNVALRAGEGVWATTWPAPYTWLGVALLPLVICMVISEVRSDIRRKVRGTPQAVGAVGGRKGSHITPRTRQGLLRYDPLLHLVQMAAAGAFLLLIGIGFFKAMAHRKKWLGKAWNPVDFLFGIRKGKGACTAASFRRYARNLARK